MFDDGSLTTSPGHYIPSALENPIQNLIILTNVRENEHDAACFSFQNTSDQGNYIWSTVITAFKHIYIFSARYGKKKGGRITFVLLYNCKITWFREDFL